MSGLWAALIGLLLNALANLCQVFFVEKAATRVVAFILLLIEVYGAYAVWGLLP